MCFEEWSIWAAQYQHTTTPEQMEEMFAVIAEQGITRVNVDVFTNGILYAESSVARAYNVTIGDDRLSWAAESARRHGLTLYAWMEYGLGVEHGSVPTNPFALSADANDWLLYNIRDGEKVSIPACCLQNSVSFSINYQQYMQRND